jgi:hypothetical protein
MRTAPLALVAFLGLAACGGDDAPPPPPPPAGGAAAAPAAGGAAGSKDKLQPRVHAEERVSCPVPEKSTGPVCKVETPTCDVGLYCLQQVDNTFHCEPCPERDSIRHEFKDRDFVSDGTADHARDPFQSFVIVPADLNKRTDKAVEPGPCTRPDQFVAANYSYQELRLVGIVQQGTQRKVLMMAGSKGQIIKRGDCVGKEKAVVKDIGTGYVTFLINPEQADNAPKRPSEEHSVQLYPNGPEMQLDQQPGFNPPSQTGPTVAPPSGTPIAPPANMSPTVAPPGNTAPTVVPSPAPTRSAPPPTVQPPPAGPPTTIKP